VNFLAEDVQIRRMTAADVAHVMEIAASLPDAPHWPEAAYLKALDPEAAPRRIGLVAVGQESGAIQGYAVASLLPPQAELESIAVAGQSQRRGVGRRLFDVLAEELLAGGSRELLLEVRASNRAALEFYRLLGFYQTGLRRGYYTDPVEDAAFMSLNFC
jgi:[ribosomal protein S18]-alanine N-acetyltransferase